MAVKKNDNANGSSGIASDGNGAAASGTSDANSDAIGAGTDSGNDATSDVGSGPVNGESGSVGNENDAAGIGSTGSEQPSGSGNTDSDAAASGTGKRGRGRPRGSGNNAGKRTAETGPGVAQKAVPRIDDDDEPAPRKVSGAAGDVDDSTPTSTRDLIDDLYMGAFWGVAEITGEDHWQLNPNESKVLADKTNTLIKSMGKVRAKRVMKSIDKYLPGFSLAVAAALIVGPRVKLSQEIKRAKYQRSTTREYGPAAAGVGQANDAPTVEYSAADAGASEGSEPVWRPLTSSDLNDYRRNVSS